MWHSPNWMNLVQRVIPRWWRRVRMMAWLRVLIWPVMQLHAAFKAYRLSTLYDMRITGQVIYLERALNDRFDNVARRIYIETQADLTQDYIYRKVEERPPLYLYRKWSPTQGYSTADIVCHGSGVWKAAEDSLNSEPSLETADWTYEKPFSPYLIRKGESLQAWDFIVWVPIELVYDEYELRALVNRYKQGGKKYTIQTF